MNDTQALTTIIENSPIELAIEGWLHAHGKRFELDEEGNQIITHSRTSKAYNETMDAFRNLLSRRGLDLDADATEVGLVAQAFAYSPAKGKPPRKTTINHRLACISSFYRYAKRKGLYKGDNPIDTVDREDVQEYAHAEALDEDTIKSALARINQSTPRGARDYALLSVLLQTGRRAQEVATLTWGQVSLRKGKARLTFPDTKGGEVLQDDLPERVTNALLRWLHRWYGADLGTLPKEKPLWVSLAHDGSYGEQLGYQSINALCKKHLGTSKVHATRHTAAHAMEQVGLSVSEIQARLGHKSLATTTRYLASLRRAENRKAEELATFYGID